MLLVVAHKKLELDYSMGVQNVNFDDYFKNDLMGLYEVLIASNLTDKLTIASKSMYEYLKNWYKPHFNKKISRNFYNIDKFFRKSYFGGRVELIKQHGADLFYYDVNSLYPSVMRDNVYPLIKKDNFDFIDYFEKNRLGIYYINAFCPSNIKIPLLPLRINKKLIFPSGYFSGVYTSQEILKAKKIGYKIDVVSGCAFKECDYIFKGFIDYYYEIKKNAVGARKEIAKMYLNSLYGKFGQKRLNYNYEFINQKDMQKDKIYSMCGSMLLDKNETWDKYSMYMHSEISSFITANARLKLYSILEQCGMNNVYYYDTDSVFTSIPQKTSLALGDLKEVSRIKEFIGIGAKLYAYIDNKDKIHITAKGFDVKSLKYTDFEKALKGELAFIHTTKSGIVKFKNGIKNNNIATSYTLERTLKNPYSKRILKDNDSIPITISI